MKVERAETLAQAALAWEPLDLVIADLRDLQPQTDWVKWLVALRGVPMIAIVRGAISEQSGSVARLAHEKAAALAKAALATMNSGGNFAVSITEQPGWMEVLFERAKGLAAGKRGPKKGVPRKMALGREVRMPVDRTGLPGEARQEAM